MRPISLPCHDDRKSGASRSGIQMRQTAVWGGFPYQPALPSWRCIESIMDSSEVTLADLGWTPFFSEQLSAQERDAVQPVRVMAVHRGMVAVAGEPFDGMISSILPQSQGPEDRPTVGDWLLVDRDDHTAQRLLNRVNLFKRPAAGDDRRTQLIAANVDTLFIVTSCNQDFNIARLERYLVLARDVGVHPVLVLTKIDITDTPEHFRDAARALEADLEVEMVNGRDPQSVERLARWCGPGQTVALLGSSGVGKSTLVNSLRGSDSIATQAVREIDGKGRHTTTVREMHRLHGGGWLVDTPGMREFKLADSTTGIAEVFDDIVNLTLECRYTNCTHEAEPGCAIQAAVREGALEPERIARWRKLSAEDAVNTTIAATRRTRAAKPGKRK